MDFNETDMHIQKCMDMGFNAYLNGKTKFDNEFEPGSLSFDAWQAGYSITEDNFNISDDKETA